MPATTIVTDDSTASINNNTSSIEQVLTNGSDRVDNNANDSNHNENAVEVLEGDEFYLGGEDDARSRSNNPNSLQQRRLRQWRESSFAVGLVNPTWWDDRPVWYCRSRRRRRKRRHNKQNDNNDNNENDGDDNNNNNDNVYDDEYEDEIKEIDHQFPISSIVCSCIGASRVGNLSILGPQIMEEYEERITIENENDDGGGETQQQQQQPQQRVVITTKKRPKLLWVIGPYWTVNVFITFPLILGVTGWVGYRRIFTNSAHIVVVITWTIGSLLLLFSLCMISCRNPGVLYRYTHIPTTTSTTTSDVEQQQQQSTSSPSQEWRWNDQAKTYRPPKAKFDPETQVVIEGFDHT